MVRGDLNVLKGEARKRESRNIFVKPASVKYLWKHKVKRKNIIRYLGN